MAAGLIYALALSTTLLFRFVPGRAGLVAGALLLVAASAVGLSRRALRPLAVAGLLAIAAALALAVEWTELWPCGLDCEGGADWRTLFGQPVLLLAAASYVAVALLWIALRSRPAAAELSTWALIGASVHLLDVSTKLRLLCGPCLSIHVWVLAAVAGLLRGRAPRWAWIVAFAGGAIALQLAYARDFERAPPIHAAPGASGPAGESAPAELTPEEHGLLARADRGRRLGGEQPKLRVEVVLSYSCGHCAATWAALQKSIAAETGAGGAELVVRLQHPRGQAEGEELVKLTHAAAASVRFGEFVSAAFAARANLRDLGSRKPGEGSPNDMAEMRRRFLHPEATVLERVTQAPEWQEVVRLLAAHPAAFDRMLREDDQVLRDLKVEGAMPQVFLIDVESGTPVERLEQAEAYAIVRAVKRRLRR